MTTAYGKGQPHTPLVESLGDLLAGDGHVVQVVAIDWTAAANAPARRYREASGVDVLMLAPRQVRWFGKTIALLSKWIWSSFSALRRVRGELGKERFDLVFVMTPAVTLAALILWARRRAGTSYAYITDFFPFHHASIGLVPGGWIKALAHWVETALLRGFDTLAVMSPLGVTYLKNRYRVRNSQKLEVLHLWTEGGPHQVRPREEVRRQFGLPADLRIAVFSGQITVGKGIEDIIEAARLALPRRQDLMFLLIGKGRLDFIVKDYIGEGGSNVSLRASLSREDYLDIISACDVGLVATIANVDVPTFPSKTIDYLKAGIPIVASVESSTDFGAFVDKEGFGIAIEAGNPTGLLSAIGRIVDDPDGGRALRAAGRATLTGVFSARRAADQIMGVLASRDMG